MKWYKAGTSVQGAAAQEHRTAAPLQTRLPGALGCRWPCMSWLLLGLILLIPAKALCARPDVRLRMSGISLRSRTGGPVGIRIKLEYNKPQLLEGNLLLKVYNSFRESEEPMATLRYDGIVLQDNDYFFNSILPPLQASWKGQYEIEAWFETEHDRIPLSSGETDVIPPDTFDLLSSRGRTMVLCSASARVDPEVLTPNRRFLHEVLSVERLLPPGTDRNPALHFFASSQSTRDLPDDPLSLCSYDMLLLSDGALEQLESAQMEAIVCWTEAGGCVCIDSADGGLTSRHVEFLKKLLQPEDAAQLMMDDGGQVRFTDGEIRVRAAHLGLGRTVLLPHSEDLSRLLTPRQVAGIRGFLWRVRGSKAPRAGESMSKPHAGLFPQEPKQNQSFRRQKKGQRLPDEKASPAGAPVGRRQDLTQGWSSEWMSPQASSLVAACQLALMPDDIRMVPFGIITAILAGYVLAIGPVDYFVLGWLGLRKYTWIVFPLFTLAFTFLMVGVAHHYLATSETGRSLIVTDLVSEGHPVRSTEVRLHYAGSRRELLVENTNMFRVPIALSVEQAFDPRLSASTGGSTGEIRQNLSPIVNYIGRFPHEFSTSQVLEQWSPTLMRSLTLSPIRIPNLPVDWDDVELVCTESGRRRLRSLLTQFRDTPCVFAAVLHGDSVLIVMAETGIPGGTLLTLGDSDADHRTSFDSTDRYGMTWLMNSVVRSTAVPPRGVFRLFSQLAPGGAAELEDLPIFDSTNPNQWMLLIMLETEAGYHLLRRNYFVRG